MARKKIIKAKRGWRRKALSFALHQLALQDGITYKEARRKYKKARFEFVVRSAETAVAQNFYRLNPDTYFKVKKGMPITSENTYGRPMKAWEVNKAQKQISYWNTVKTLANVMDISSKEARKYITEQKKELKKKYRERYGKLPTFARLEQMTQHSVWVDLGVYGDRYPVIRP